MKIGIFDSGLGGLVITKAFINTMPEYDYVYYGDTAHLPYGDKTSGSILAYSLEAIKFLIRQNCAVIIIACNTATSIALRYIQQRFIPSYAPEVKVLGVVIPTVEIAAELSSRKIGVVATAATVRSRIYHQELQKINPELAIQEVAAPLLVPAIENNNFSRARELVNQYAKDFSDINSLILGCTHYPLVKQYFAEELPGVKIVSQDELMGAKLKDYLSRHWEIDITLGRHGDYKFLVNNLNQHYQKVAETLFPDIPVQQVEDINGSFSEKVM